MSVKYFAINDMIVMSVYVLMLQFLQRLVAVHHCKFTTSRMFHVSVCNSRM